MTEIIARGGTYPSNNIWKISKSHVTVRNYPGEQPLLDNNWEYPRLAAYPDDMPTVLYEFSILVTGNYVVIDGINVTKSRGQGIGLRGAYGIVKNAKVDYCLGTGIKAGVEYVDGYNTVENCTVMWCNHARDNGAYSAWSNIGCNVRSQGNHNTIKNCVVGYAPAAGIEGYLDNYSVIENNIVFGNKLTQIHEARSKNATIRNNLIYGVERPGFSGTGFGVGIAIMTELWYDAANWDYGHKVYNNLIANTPYGIQLDASKGDATKTGWPFPNKLRDVWVYGNTVIEPNLTAVSYQKSALKVNYKDYVTTNASGETVNTGVHLGDNIVIKNNLFWQSSGAIAEGLVDTAKADLGYNLWSIAPASSFREATDPGYPAYSALVMNNYFAKTSGWSQLAANSLSANDFKVLSTAAAAINRGAALAAEYNRDYWNTQRPQGAAWDIGAHEYAIESDTNPPAAPSGLAVR